MAEVDALDNEVICRICYVGADQGGKRTSLEHVQEHIPPSRRGDSKVDQRGCMSFDYLPIDVGKVGDMGVRVQLTAVPAAVLGSPAGYSLLAEVDALIVVFDSRPEQTNATAVQFARLHEYLRRCGRRNAVPMVLQYNHRDATGARAVDAMDRDFNPAMNWSVVETNATTGEGVFSALRTAVGLAVESAAHSVGATKVSGGYQVDGTADESLVSSDEDIETQAMCKQIGEPGAETRLRLLRAEVRSLRRRSDQQSDELRRLHHLLAALYDLLDRRLPEKSSSQVVDFTPYEGVNILDGPDKPEKAKSGGVQADDLIVP